MTSPDNKVTGPTGNRIAPIMIPTTIRVKVAASAKAAAPKNLTNSNLPRLTGAVNRYLRVPVFASPAIVSPATTPIVSGKNNGIARIIAVKPTNIPF